MILCRGDFFVSFFVPTPIIGQRQFRNQRIRKVSPATKIKINIQPITKRSPRQYKKFHDHYPPTHGLGAPLTHPPFWSLRPTQPGFAQKRWYPGTHLLLGWVGCGPNRHLKPG